MVEYARSKEKEYDKKFRFTITTNGLLLNDDMIDFINKEMYNVVCSTDGRKEVNDRVRARVDGSGCYDAIIPALPRSWSGSVRTRISRELAVLCPRHLHQVQ